MKPFSSILVDIDATAVVHPALDRAVEVARATGAALRVVDVMGFSGEGRRYLSPDVDDDLMRRRREQLARIVYGVRDVTVHVDTLAGPPAVALVRDVLRFGHDLVVRSHARDLIGDGQMSEVDVHLFRHCPCPVWAVGPGAAPQSPKIVATIDAAAQDSSKQHLTGKVIDLALEFSTLQQGRLILLHAWQPPWERRVQNLSTAEEYSAYLDGARRGAKDDLARLVESYGVRLAGAQLELRRGDIEHVVPELVVAEGADLVVIGSMGRVGIARHLMGNTAERVVRKLPCSLLVVKPDDFVSSVR